MDQLPIVRFFIEGTVDDFEIWLKNLVQPRAYLLSATLSSDDRLYAIQSIQTKIIHQSFTQLIVPYFVAVRGSGSNVWSVTTARPFDGICFEVLPLTDERIVIEAFRYPEFNDIFFWILENIRKKYDARDLDKHIVEPVKLMVYQDLNRDVGVPLIPISDETEDDLSEERIKANEKYYELSRRAAELATQHGEMSVFADVRDTLENTDPDFISDLPEFMDELLRLEKILNGE